MLNTYSIAIVPPEPVVTEVKTMKEALATEIGWFNSKNSIAHFTINEFEAEENVIIEVKKQLLKLCDTLHPIEVLLNTFDTFPNNGAFFIVPDETSKRNLQEIMKYLNKSLRITTKFKNNEPHLSIARRLSLQHIEVAHHLFTAVQISFLCDNIALRKFNPTIKQFEVIERFPLNGNSMPTSSQGSLF